MGSLLLGREGSQNVTLVLGLHTERSPLTEARQAGTECRASSALSAGLTSTGAEYRMSSLFTYPQGFESGVSMPGLVLPSGSGTEIGVTLTLATPLSCVIPIFCAVDGERSTIRPFTYGPRSWIVTTAL